MTQAYEFGPLLESNSVASIHAGSRVGAKGFEKVVSLIVVQPELSRDREFSRAFVDAAECFAGTSIRGVLHVDDVAEERGRLFAVSSALDGTSLARLLDCPASAAKALAPEVSCRIVRLVADSVFAVAKALATGKPLGGLSAEAVWVTSAGDVVVMPTALSAAKVPARFRRPGAARYRAPELDGRKPAGPSADVYSLGLLLWDLLAHGRAPASDLNAATSAVSPIIDAQLVRLVMRCLSPAPEERPVNVAALGIELAKSVRRASAIRNSDIAAAVAAMLSRSGQGKHRAAKADTLEIRTEELECIGTPNAYEVAEAPIRHVSDFTKGARPAVPRPRGPSFEKTRQRAITFEPRLVGSDGSWLRLSGRAGRWVIGRGHAADLVALDPDMSREHFEVVLGSDGSFRVRDLGSKNGLFLNGERAVAAPLRAGDELRAGATILRFEV
jgi:hypothetical protein